MTCNIRPVKKISDISEMETLKKNLRKVFMKKFKTYALIQQIGI
jgi:hypothetical protein